MAKDSLKAVTNLASHAASSPTGATADNRFFASTVIARRRMEAIRVLVLALYRELEAPNLTAVPKEGLNLHNEVARFEADLIRSALAVTGNRQRQAARLLGMKVATLNAKVKKYQLIPRQKLENSEELDLRLG